MKKSAFAVLLFSTSLCLASGPAPLNDPGDIAAIKKIGRDMGDAMVAVDIDKLNQIYADDWAIVSSSGKVVTKEKILSDFKSGADKLVSYELGPIDVQVLGDIAVAHGTVKEKRVRNGKDVSGEGVYMDFLEKRAGKWMVVRSGGKIVPSEPRSR
jgi:ketosteroid isomerase-like protein